MGDTLRYGVGLLGNAVSLFLYGSPMLVVVERDYLKNMVSSIVDRMTFAKVVRTKSTQGFSCVPYVVALFSCLIFTWYGLPVVSRGWENYPVVTINGIGVLLQLSFILIFLWFAQSQKLKMRVLGMALAVILAFAGIVAITLFGIHDHRRRKNFIGSLQVMAAVSLFAAPLVAVKKVIQTKSVEFMPFYLSFFSFLTSSVWLVYGLVGHDMFIVAPNTIGTPLGVLQLLVYYKYANKGKIEESNIGPEMNSSKQLQVVISTHGSI